MEMTSGLDQNLSPDPGDDTASRFRYQWTCAAIICCGLLDSTLKITEVFCEHHEDVLVKYENGTYTGYQIKTKADNQNSWIANDEAIISAFARFVKLDMEFPNSFSQFRFLTNHTLVSDGTGKDLSFILNSIKLASEYTQLGNVPKAWVRKISLKSNIEVNDCMTTLKKAKIESSLPKLQDILMRLIHTISQCWPPSNNCSVSLMQKLSHALVDECGRASSLDNLNLLPGYFSIVSDRDTEIAEIIKGKSISKLRLEEILQECHTACEMLLNDDQQSVTVGEGSSELLLGKLDAGGFSTVSIDSAQDLRASADYLGLKWINQYGNKAGLDRYKHITSCVQADAGRALDQFQDSPDKFGPQMREALRLLFKSRREQGVELFNATDDHLEGFAFSLTAQCKIVWSHAKPWEKN